MAADVVVFDPEKKDLAEPKKVADLPEGAPRYIQGAKGIQYTIVDGSVLMKNGAHTGVYSEKYCGVRETGPCSGLGMP